MLKFIASDCNFLNKAFLCRFYEPSSTCLFLMRIIRKEVLVLYRSLALITILIFLLTNTVVTTYADDVTSSNLISFNETEKERSGFSAQQLWRSDIIHSPLISGITDCNITNYINNALLVNTLIDLKAKENNTEDSGMSLFTMSLPTTTIRQPIGIVLIMSAILGLFLRVIRKKYRQLKPLTDYCISFIGLLITSPVFFVVGIIIKITSRGPVFYTQERVGKDGRLFNIIKFRTMHVNAESQTGPVWAKRNDMRITHFGRFLRKTHMDELPQLINVIRGEMSIIGPRPERPFFVRKFKEEIPGYSKRLSVKPGITGLAQCYHRYDETIRDVRRKLKYDIIYINRMCWSLDSRILWRTLTVSLLRGG